MSASSSTGSTEGMRSRNGCSAAGCAGVSVVGSSGVGSSAGACSGQGVSTGDSAMGSVSACAGGSSSSTDVGSACVGEGGDPALVRGRQARPRSARLSWAARQATAQATAPRPVSRRWVRRVLPLPKWAQCSTARWAALVVVALLRRTVRSRLVRLAARRRELAVRRQAAPPERARPRASARLPVSAQRFVASSACVGWAGPVSDGRDEFGIWLRLGVRLDLRLPCQSSLHRRLPVGGFSHVCNRLAGVGRLIGQARCRQGQNAVRYVLDLRRQLIGRVGPGRAFYALVPQRFRGAGVRRPALTGTFPLAMGGICPVGLVRHRRPVFPVRFIFHASHRNR